MLGERPPGGKTATEFNIKDTHKWQLKQVTGLFFHKTENANVSSPGLLFTTLSRSTVLFSWSQDGCSASGFTSTEQVEQEESKKRQKAYASSLSIFIRKTMAFPEAPSCGLLCYQNFVPLPPSLPPTGRVWPNRHSLSTPFLLREYFVCALGEEPREKRSE